MYILDTGWINKLQFDLVESIFKMLAWAYDLLISFTEDSLFSSENISLFTDSIYILVGIFMLFRLAISMLNYLINPDSFSDKSSGGSKMLTRVVVSMLLIIGSSFVFDELITLQKNIVSTDGGIIFRIIRLNDKDGNTVSGAVNKPSDTCYPTGGSVIASTAMKAFISGADEGFDENLLWYFARSSGDECDAAVDDNSQKHIDAVKAIEDGFENANYNIDMLLAMIAGIGIVVFILIMAIDIVVRNLKILLLQMISPVAFVSYMNPKDKIFNQWLKNYGSVYADLFIKLIAVAFVIVLVNFLHDNTDISGFGAVFYLMGILVFAKAVPSFISKIFGIDGAGSFKESAGMLKKGLGFGAGAAALALGAGFAAHKANKADRQQRINKGEDFKAKWKSAEGAKGKAKALLSGAGRAAVQSGRAAKMVSTSAIKGAGAGFQGKGISSAFSGAIAEGDNLATAIEGGATFKQRAFAGVNKTFGTDIGGLSKAKEKKEALDELNKKDSELKSKIKEEMYKKNTAGIAESQMRLDAMEQANKDGNYERVLLEMGYEKKAQKIDGKIVSVYENSNGDTINSNDIANEARAKLAEQRTAHAEMEKATIQAVINGKFIDKDGKKQTTDILSSTPELQKLSQELEEASVKAINAGAEVGAISRKTDSAGNMYLDFGGAVSDVNIQTGLADKNNYYTDSAGKTGKDVKSVFKIYSDNVVTKSQEVATELQQSGAGAARTYQENKNKK